MADLGDYFSGSSGNSAEDSASPMSSQNKGIGGGFLKGQMSNAFGTAWNPPGYNAPGLTQGTVDAYGNLVSEANTSPEELENQMMSGVNEGRGLIKTGSQIGEAQGAMGNVSSAAQNEALANKAQRSYGQALGSLQRKMPQIAQQMAMQRQMQANKVLEQRDQWTIKVADAEIKSIFNEQAARGAVLGSITGLVGAVLGTYVGGGAGAKAGAKGGKGMAGGGEPGGETDDTSGNYNDFSSGSFAND